MSSSHTNMETTEKDKLKWKSDIPRCILQQDPTWYEFSKYFTTYSLRRIPIKWLKKPTNMPKYARLKKKAEMKALIRLNIMMVAIPRRHTRGLLENDDFLRCPGFINT